VSSLFVASCTCLLIGSYVCVVVSLPGLHLEHGSVSKYLTWAKKSVENRSKFTRSLDKYIAKHNGNPLSVRLHSRKELEAAEKVKTKETTGTRRLKPERHFHEKWAWERDNEGKDWKAEGLVLCEWPWLVIHMLVVRTMSHLLCAYIISSAVFVQYLICYACESLLVFVACYACKSFCAVRTFMII
jgi:hypothetical protein